jgi:hypothetical protein
VCYEGGVGVRKEMVMKLGEGDVRETIPPGGNIRCVPWYTSLPHQPPSQVEGMLTGAALQHASFDVIHGLLCSQVEGMYDLEEKKAQDKWEQERRASALEAAAAAGRPSISGATGGFCRWPAGQPP